MLLGFEARNSPILLAEDWEKIDALGSTVLKLRSYHCIPENIPAIAQRNLVVILRPSSDGDLNPSDCYFEMGEALTRLLDAGVPEIVLYPDSEPNLHDRPMPADYWSRVATFFVLIDRQFGQYTESGRLKYASPPMAVAQGDEAWLQAATVVRRSGMNEGATENLLTGFDFYGGHFYGQQDTSLVQRGIHLANVYAPGVPIIAAEVGDASNADPSTKTEAIIQYLTLLQQAGAYAACLFIVGSHDPQWSGFVLPIEQIRHIGAAVRAAEPHPQPAEAMPMRTWTREEIIERIIGYADAAGVPRRLALACGIAESNLRQYAERYGTWPDVSFGIGQQIVLYAPVGNRTNTPENIALVRDWLFDPENAIPLMVGKLAENYDNRRKAGLSDADAQWAALYRYNTGTWLPPGGQYAGNVENYRRAFVAADAILATWEDELTPERKAEVKVGLDKLWALASAFEQNNDQPNADYIKAEVIRIKDAVRL